MDPRPWDRAVEIELGKAGRYRVVTNTLTAAEILLNHWPVEAGPAHFAACYACLDVLEGNQAPEYAKLAFIKAAEEAGIFFRLK